MLQTLWSSMIPDLLLIFSNGDLSNSWWQILSFLLS